MGLEDCYEISYEVSLPGVPSSGTIIAAGTYPDWAKRIEGTKSIIYTGTGCPAWVGIGTSLPDARLDVKGDARFSSGVRIGKQERTETALHIENRYKGSGNMFDTLIVVKDHKAKKVLQLENNGLLRARRIKIDQQPWADNVFKADYNLMPLNELRFFIKTNGHLPEVPTTEEVQENGVDLAETNALLLKKIEELTLYLLEQKEETEELRKELEELKALVNQQ